ncbi:hypothetical protein LTR84_012008 [Exophiala bonariae]|uniref:Xylanolytic transcriptional activator regulatory domain-containing protein n=1 Tax=Exophiala bonariae TaxID=1690606 RepID=A0AAV9MRX2_9EURO|nr:hypothetical protein LTR84_012008 [Exophiala bonariae]
MPEGSEKYSARQATTAAEPAPSGIRKVKACTTCRTQKLKCDMPGESVSASISQLQTAVGILLRTSNLPPLSAYSSSKPAVQIQQDDHSNVDDDNGEAVPIASSVDKTDGDIYSSPINSLYEVTKGKAHSIPLGTTVQRDYTKTDFIAQGLISLETAESFFQSFTSRLGWFCYGIMCPHQSLESLRGSSTVLTAAVCTVAALHDPEASSLFRVCQMEYRNLVASKMFATAHSADDVRALIIGAWWLGNISYTLHGHATRIATSLNYHLAYYEAIKGCTISRDKARLWYVLYVMDQHSSILYGRPAIISSKNEPCQEWERFIAAGGGGEPDIRVSSQVALYAVTTKLKDILDGLPRQLVPQHFLHQLRPYFHELDRWYMVWGNRMQINPYIGSFSTDGAILNYHFARLHLCSYIFRGMSVEAARNASQEVRDYATVAIDSATATVELVLGRNGLRDALVGMPLYFHGMIIFAAVFLLKAVDTHFLGMVNIDAVKNITLVENLGLAMRSHGAARQHLTYHVSRGLEKMVTDTRARLSEQTAKDHGRLATSAYQQQASDIHISLDTSPQLDMMDNLFTLDAFDIFQQPIECNDASLFAQKLDWEATGTFQRDIN